MSKSANIKSKGSDNPAVLTTGRPGWPGLEVAKLSSDFLNYKRKDNVANRKKVSITR